MTHLHFFILRLMYQDNITFYGLPLSQRNFEYHEHFLSVLAEIAALGYSLEEMTSETTSSFLEELLDDENSLFYSFDDHQKNQVHAFLNWFFTHQSILSQLGVEWDTAYSGSGESPYYFGIPLSFRHRGAFQADKQTQELLDDHPTAQPLLDLLRSSLPLSIQNSILFNLGFWSMHATS